MDMCRYQCVDMCMNEWMCIRNKYMDMCMYQCLDMCMFKCVHMFDMIYVYCLFVCIMDAPAYITLCNYVYYLGHANTSLTVFMYVV